MICDSLFKRGVEIEIDHVFSCEIEPYKQAYIERNFLPPLLFRDIWFFPTFIFPFLSPSNLFYLVNLDKRRLQQFMEVVLQSQEMWIL